jgi:ParB family transcriptional regulator, chromosome partitioning protein
MSARRSVPPPDTAGVSSALAQRFSLQQPDDTPTTHPAAAEPVPVEDVAYNPRNRRRMAGARWEAKVAELAASIEQNGQLEACAVVTRVAFLRVFPEFEERIGATPYVHVNGARRHAAVVRVGLPTLRVDVRDELAATRAAFLAATGAENINRESFTAVEEAWTIHDMVEAAESQAAVARALGKTPPWVTQRLHLLKLTREVQDALDEGELRPGQVREWHRLSPDEQVTKLASYRRAAGRAESLTAVNDDPDAPPEAESRPPASRVDLAIRRLGGSPERIAASLRIALPPEDLKALVEYLTDNTDG